MYYNSSRLVQVAMDDDSPVSPVQMGHLDPVVGGVSPVEEVGDPVNGQTDGRAQVVPN